MIINTTQANIVKDGLVLWLDAGHRASYPEVGTAWYDISGNRNVGTLVNGPTYDSANKGSIFFDRNNDYITIPQETGEFSNSKMTIDVWVKPNVIGAGGSIIAMDRPTYNGNTGIELFFLSTGILSARGSGGTRADSIGNVTLNQWNFCSYVFDETTVYIYLNGVFDNSGSVESVNTTNYTLHIGRFPDRKSVV